MYTYIYIVYINPPRPLASERVDPFLRYKPLYFPILGKGFTPSLPFPTALGRWAAGASELLPPPWPALGALLGDLGASKLPLGGSLELPSCFLDAFWKRKNDFRSHVNRFIAKNRHPTRSFSKFSKNFHPQNLDFCNTLQCF